MAILPVLALHLKPLLPLPPPAYRWAWDHIQRNGTYGVCLFFLISGFLITRIIDSMPKGLFEPSWKKFYVRRTGRILPLFLLVALLGSMFFAVLGTSSEASVFCFKLPANPWDAVFWGSIFLFVFNWAKTFAMGTWQGIGLHWVVFWSLAVEEQFYVFYPWLLRWLGNDKKLIRFMGFVIFAGLAWRWFLFAGLFPRGLDLKWGSFSFFDQIALGVILYVLQKRLGPYLSKAKRTSFALTAVGLSTLAAVYWGTYSEEELDWVLGPILMALGLFFFLLGGLNLSFFESKFWAIFAYPGKYSYGNYLLHVSVLYLLHTYLAGLNVFAAFAIFVTASTLVSAFSFHLFEVPVNRWARSLMGA